MTISALAQRAAPAFILVGAFLPSAMPAQSAASQSSPADAALTVLSAKIDALSNSLDETRAELSAARAEIRELHNQLHGEAASTSSNSAATSLSAQVATLEEQQQVLESQVQQHEQTKVETVSKYPVRLTGLLLFNTLRTEGTVDNPYAPTFAVPPYQSNVHGSLQGTVRQSILGLNARGPVLAGASTSADVATDFFGGLANYGSNTNMSAYDEFVRLRSFHVRIDWPDTQVAFSYDHPIISPHTPASLSAVGVPALAWSGNLWNWQPQLTARNRLTIGGDQKLEFAAGLMDVPDPPSFASGLSAAERSRYPGSEARIGYLRQHSEYGETSFGIGGYFSPHNYGYDGSVNAWAITADYSIPLPAHLALTGLIYRGAALGGLGGGTYKDVVSIPGNSGENYLEALHDAGGWSQVKFAPARRLEFNAAYGIDNGDANQLRTASYPSSTYTALARNQTTYGNIIYRPSAYLLFSGEFRYVRSWPIYDAATSAQIYSLSTGYQF
jgi:hypothetical protein